MLTTRIVFSMSLSLRRQFMYSTRSKRKRKKRPSTTSRLANSVIERRSTVAKRHEASGIQLIRGSDNVFEDVGFEAEEAANLKIRADLLLDLRQYIQARGWTQAEAAAF